MTWDFPDVLERLTKLADEFKDLGLEYRIEAQASDGSQTLALKSHGFREKPAE